LAINFDADLLAMLDLNDFAVSATYETTISGVPITSAPINGIYDDAYFDIVDGNNAVESSQPAFTCRTVDVANVKHGDLLTINSVVYTIVGNKPDGTGQTVLPLEAP